MKRIICFITIIFISQILNGQSKHTLDSLNNVVITSAQDTSRIMALCELAFLAPDNISKFSFANKALALSRKIKFEKGEAVCYHQLGNYFTNISDYSQSLEYHLKALKIREKLNLTIDIASSLNAIGIMYALQQNNAAALAYYFKAENALKQIKTPGLKAILYRRIGNVYLRQNKLDSALIYLTRSYENANTKGGGSALRYTLVDLGNVHTSLGNTELAFSYHRMAIASAIKASNMSRTTRVGLANSYYGLAKLFMKTSKKDSAIYYAKKTLHLNRLSQNKTGIMDAARLLAQLFANRDDREEIRYLKMVVEAQDSVFSGSNTAKFQSMTFSEQERQRDINESSLKEAEERKHNLQFAALAIGLITFIMLFFALSRSIIVKNKFIEFSGVLLLLAVFEFINLFIHPYLAHATNDSPVLMLFVLIVIGAMLVPLHHKLEKWITKIMVEKNKKIRLEAAEKTIAELTVNKLIKGYEKK